MKTGPALTDDDLRERFEIVLSDMDFEALENYLKLENGTLKEIFNNDTDWAMIIKIGVLTEAILDSFLSVGFDVIPQEFFCKTECWRSRGEI